MLLCFFILLCSAFGFCCVVWVIADWCTGSQNQATAVLILNERDARMMDLLLQEAKGAFSFKGKRNPVVLISYDLMHGTVGYDDMLFEEYERVLERYGAECYLIEP